MNVSLSMLLFPEGTRNSAGGGSLLPFKKGAFHVALDIKAPILPIVVSEYDFLGPDGSRQGPLITDGRNSSKWTGHYVGWSKTLQMGKIAEQNF